MRKLDVVEDGNTVLRVLEIREGQCLVIDCGKMTMPFWTGRKELEGRPARDLCVKNPEPDREAEAAMRQRFTMIAPILSVVCDEKQRGPAIRKAAEEHQVSPQTVRKYLCRFLAYQDIRALAPNVGVGMLDSTVCDVYLVDGAGQIVGRPILTACVDAYSSLCCGYALSFEGGIYNAKKPLIECDF